MALLFMDSFDHYLTADLPEKWTAQGTTSAATLAINATAGRRGGGALRCFTAASATNPTFYVLRGVPAVGATAILGFSCVVPAGTMGTAGIGIASIRDGASAQLTLRLNQDYTLSVIRGAQNGTLLATSASAALSAGAVAYLEWKVLIDPSAGTVDVRVNGAPVSGLVLTAQNTRATAASQWNSFTLGMVDAITNATVSASKNIDYDDLYVLDGSGAAPWNTFLGDCRVDVRLPTAPGATTGWTPLAGANWAAVDDAAPDDDTTYVATSVVGVTDTFVTQDAPVPGATIFGVQHVFSLKKMDAGVCTVAPVIRHSGVDYPGAAIAPGTAYAFGVAIAQVNPGTSAAWVEADFNAAEFGYKRTA